MYVAVITTETAEPSLPTATDTARVAVAPSQLSGTCRGDADDVGVGQLQRGDVSRRAERVPIPCTATT